MEKIYNPSIEKIANVVNEAKAKNAIQAELIKFAETAPINFDNPDWFEILQEDFESNYAVKHSISFVFDENLNVSIVYMEGE